jgi:4-alpha-glucanotransferase
VHVVMASPSWLALFQITDVLALADRFNTPGSTSTANWSYRLPFTVKQLQSHAGLRARADRFSRLARETGRTGGQK